MDKQTILVGLGGVLVLLWAALERWRENRLLKSLLKAKDEEIDTLLQEIHELNLLARSPTVEEAQKAIELDRLSARTANDASQSFPSEEADSIPPPPRTFQVGGRPFTLIGVNEEAENEFIKNVIEEVGNARPVPTRKS